MEDRKNKAHFWQFSELWTRYLEGAVAGKSALSFMISEYLVLNRDGRLGLRRTHPLVKEIGFDCRGPMSVRICF